MRIRTILGLFSVLALTTTVEAGITDPAPPGFATVWSVPGVMNNLSVGAAFICTATAAANVSVEVFDASGALQSNGVSAGLNPGQSATFVTQGLPNLVATHNLGVTTVFQGSARVVASSSKVICTALLMDTAGNLISGLPIVKKTSQKGQ